MPQKCCEAVRPPSSAEARSASEGEPWLGPGGLPVLSFQSPVRSLAHAVAHGARPCRFKHAMLGLKTKGTGIVAASQQRRPSVNRQPDAVLVA